MTEPLIDMEELAAALHSADHGWNCGHHGVMESIHREKYLRLADAAAHYLRSVLTPEALEATEKVPHGPYVMRYAASGNDLHRRIFGEDK